MTAKLKPNLESFLQVYGGLNVLLLHTGLALLEAGRSRKKNVASALTRQLACLLLSVTAFWICGYAFAFGKGNPFIGSQDFYVLSDTSDARLPHFFLQALLSSIPVSILGGAVAERAHITGLLLLSVIISGLVYPVVAHWVWHSQGWLFTRDCVDTGGILPVHVLSGSISLTACLVVGRRIEKFGANNSALQGHSLPLSFIGGLLLIIGMIGKTVGITANSSVLPIGQVVVNCLLSGAGAGTLAVLLYKISISKDSGYSLTDMTQNASIKVTNRRWSFYCCLNGCVAGLVAVQGGVGSFPHWGAFVVGLVAGCLTFVISQALQACRLDDCTETVSIHFGGGLWGTIAAPLLANKDVLGSSDPDALDRGLLVSWSVAGAGATIAWSVAIVVLLMVVLLVIGKLRVDTKVETLGADVFKMEEQAYPSNKFNTEVTVDGNFYHFKSPGLSPILHKKNQRPLGVAPGGNASLTAVVPPCFNNNGVNYLSSTQKLEMKELSCSIPKIIVEETDKKIKPRIPKAPPPPPYTSSRGSLTDSCTEPLNKALPTIEVTDDSGLKAPPSSPNTSLSGHNPALLQPVNANLTNELRETLKHQKQRLKATVNLMKRPSMSLIPRNLSNSSVHSITSDNRDDKMNEIAEQPTSFNYLDKGKSLKKRGEVVLRDAEDDDVFEDDIEDSKVSADESGFGSSTTQLIPKVKPVAKMKRLTEKELEEAAGILQQQLQADEVDVHNESNII